MRRLINLFFVLLFLILVPLHQDKAFTPTPKEIEISRFFVPNFYNVVEEFYKNPKPLTIKYSTLNYSNEEIKKLDKAISILAIILNSEEYKQEVLNFRYDDSYSFKENLFMSNKEIYYYTRLGAEEINPYPDYTMNLKLKMYFEKNLIIGYTYFNHPIIYTNNYYYEYFNECDIADNLTHEWMHQLGFGHDESSPDIYYTVPYATGNIVKKLCYLSKIEKLHPVKD